MSFNQQVVLEYLKKEIKKFDNGKIQVGKNGYYDACNDEINAKNFYLIKKYSELNIGYGFVKINTNKYLKYKSIEFGIIFTINFNSKEMSFKKI